MSVVLRRSLEYLCAGLLFVIVAVVFINVVGRYFFHAPLRWSDEVAQFLFLWLSYLGALAALMGGRNLLPGRLRVAAKTVSDLIVLGMLAILVWCGMQLVDLLRHQRSPAIDLPIYYVYAALPLVSLLMALVVAFQLVRRLRGGSELAHEAAEAVPSQGAPT
jgi:TRAP-type C4-dicarboxylate transport system permease small subunit